MGEVTVYLFAQATGNEQTRKIYFERIKRNVLTLDQIGQGEWDSENSLRHIITNPKNRS